MPRTINDIIPPSRRRAMENPEQPAVPNTTPIGPPHDAPSDIPPAFSPPPRVQLKVRGNFPYGTAIVALVVVALGAGVLYLFAGAKVDVTPASQNVSVNGAFSATNASGDLPFMVITVSKTASASVPAESSLTAHDSAQGSISISNAQQTPQTLINNTRFSTPDGLIFHIHAPVIIPAATAAGPGTLTATVYADQPGQNYNVGPTTFTVPGLKGSSAYTQVTAKSDAPMMGGFSGTRGSVSQATDDTQHTKLQSALAANLQSALAAKIPAGDALVPGGSFISYQVTPDTSTATSTVAINETGTAIAVIFPTDALAKAIAYKMIGTYSGEPVKVADVSTLALTPVTSLTASLANANTFAFSLSGTAKIIWKVDSVRIAGAVAGKTRDSAQAILKGFPEVDRATLTLRPFWTTTFPQDPTHIKVTVTPKSP